jgi:lysophospholipase L1-like esterase
VSTFGTGIANDPEILLWGDSLTKGDPGVAFTGYLYQAVKGIRWVNHGKGGDTALSLLKRIEAEPVPPAKNKALIAVLWIGVNDVFADLVPGYGLLKTARRQPPTRNVDTFEGIFRSILDNLFRHAHRIIALPPLFVGEDPGSDGNRKLVIMSDLVSKICSEYPECRFADLRLSLSLSSDNPPGFLPVNPWSKIVEFFGRIEIEDYDKAAERRGLNWTYDGVHLNSNGAREVSRILSNVIEEELKKAIS